MTWATSHVVFALPWALASFVDDARDVPHDTPVFWLDACESFRRHWSVFHASLFQFFYASVFQPLGGGHLAVVAVVAFSTSFHGFQTHWLIWGLVNGLGLSAERVVDARGETRRRTPREGTFGFAREAVSKAARRTVAIYSAVLTTCGRGFDARAHASVFGAFFACSCAWEATRSGDAG